MKVIKFNICSLSLISVFFSCSTIRNSSLNQQGATVSSVKFLSEYVIPLNIHFKNTVIGGLSGIDYDFKNNQYYLISDDPSQFSPARIYTAKIDIKENKIDTVKFTGVKFLLQQSEKKYPKYKFGVNSKADGESLRYNPKSGNLIWGNEGERLFRPTDTTLVQPALTFISTEGKFLDTIPLPAGFVVSKKETGFRKNSVFEGLSFADNYQTLYASVEEPLYQDGPKSAYKFDKALTRILKFDVKTKKNTAQYAYNLDAMPVQPTMENSWNVNGISEILAINNHTLLVIERAWAKGYDDKTFVRLYLVNLKGAENEINNPSFITNPPQPLKKKLLFNFDTLNMHIDNIEGITFGPKLPNGNNTLVFCVDNNFAKNQTQQFFLFEVIP
ncbi:esterase-like activity of phytase family protein [Pedobacter changchengzhani]|uniref:esterase-like activity of phytase family protein n=1 Tax=Pedobacter changchengzhani TaxID=2529274 RepID=UPI0014045E9C|nr:esterase-like activity of phytase family protein [Pedobacter changchengzhani]